ncbi:MAG: HAD family phosphatase [Nitrospirae bacterium]|nr:HAD family phosphatase [Candidatus Manganitrophaceae bacterium]
MDQSIHNIVFDLGGVLLEWKPDQILARLYPDPDLRAVVNRQVFQHPDWLVLDKGALDEEGAVNLFHRRTERPLSEMKELMQAVRESLVPIPSTFDLLEALSKEGLALYCVSNMQVAVFAYLQKKYDFWSKFKGLVISAHIQMIKPDAEIFRHLFTRYGLIPSESLFIDDHFPNVESARRLEMKAILFQGADDCRRQLQELHLLPHYEGAAPPVGFPSV